MWLPRSFSSFGRAMDGSLASEFQYRRSIPNSFWPGTKALSAMLNERGCFSRLVLPRQRMPTLLTVTSMSPCRTRSVMERYVSFHGSSISVSQSDCEIVMSARSAESSQ